MTLTARARLIGILPPLVIAGAGLAATLAILPKLRYPVAVHWGPTGQPDEFGSPVPSLIVLATVVAAYAVFSWAATRRSNDGLTVNQRLILAIGTFLATLLTATLAGSLILQLGVVDPRTAPSVIPLVAAGFLGGAALAASVWLALPRQTPQSAARHHITTPLPLTPTENAVWIRRIHPRRSLGAGIVVLLVLLAAVGGAALWIAADVLALSFYLLALALVAASIAATLYWEVVIDRDGFRARAALGWPRWRIPLSAVESAGVVEVDPIRDFGGWGIRWSGRRTVGIVTRAGEALEVRCVDGRVRVITVDHADQAAALLTSLRAMPTMDSQASIRQSPGSRRKNRGRSEKSAAAQ